MIAEFFRERRQDGHGPVHIYLQTPGKVRGEWVECGRQKTGMRKMGTPFREWETVACPECMQAMTDAQDEMELG